MKTPEFWHSKGLLSTLMLPLSFFYSTADKLKRNNTKPVILPVPVFCVGNLTAGGSGKTPVALAIGQRLKNKGVAAFFLTRGYGGKLKGPLLVDPDTHSVHEVGDEALMLAHVLPTIVAKDRVAGGRFAVEKGAKAIVMDDGFQNPSLSKTLSFVVVDGSLVFGNGRIIPAGPLRETVDNGISRAHVVIVINRTNAVPSFPGDKPVLLARTEPSGYAPAVKGQKILAFCGIAYPKKFFNMLSTLGAQLTDVVSFPDHHVYSNDEIKKLGRRAKENKAFLVTTGKDIVRIAPGFRERIAVVDINIAFDNETMLDNILDFVLKLDEKT